MRARTDLKPTFVKANSISIILLTALILPFASASPTGRTFQGSGSVVARSTLSASVDETRKEQSTIAGGPSEPTHSSAALPITATGTLQAREQITILAKTPGTIARIYVDRGSVVHAGDQIAQLQTDSIALQLTQAEAALAMSQAAAAVSQAALEGSQARLDALLAGPTKEQIAVAETQVRLAANQRFQIGATADATFNSPGRDIGAVIYNEDMRRAQNGVAYEQVQLAQDQLAALRAPPKAQDVRQAQATVAGSQAGVAQSRAAVDQAQAARDLVALQLRDATIRAPFSGVISQRQLSEGALVSQATPIVTLLSQQIQAVVNVDESMLMQLQEGQRATLSILALPDTEVAASVVAINPVIDAESRTVAVYLTPDEADARLRPGLFVQAHLLP
jgi:HlyD family secretion protein